MSLPFIAFYMGDYQRDTLQLPLEGHGAYFLLLQYCWTNGRIPADDAARAAICKVTVSRWRRELAPLVAGYFDENGENKRANIEIAKVERMRLRKAMAGHNGGIEAQRRKAIAQATVQAVAQATAKLPSSGRYSGSEAIKKEDITTTFSAAAREEPPVDNSATAPAAPPAGSAGKPAKLAPSPELLAVLARKNR